MHCTALVAQPISALDALFPGRASAVARLALLVWFEGFVVEELLQGHEEDVALHRSNTPRRDDALRLADGAEEGLARPNVALCQAGFEAFEAKTVQARKDLRSVELIRTDRTVQETIAKSSRVVFSVMTLNSSHIFLYPHKLRTELRTGELFIRHRAGVQDATDNALHAFLDDALQRSYVATSVSRLYFVLA